MAWSAWTGTRRARRAGGGARAGLPPPVTVAAVLAVGLALPWLAGCSDAPEPAPPGASQEIRSAVWPPAPSPYDDPGVAAEEFLREYVGFADPVVVDVRRGDARSAEVVVRSTPDAEDMATTVLVRRVDDAGWSVIGATSEGIRVAQPTALDVVASPVSVSGEARAYEGTLHVEIRADDGASGRVIARDIADAGALAELQPFHAEVVLDAPEAGGGAVIVADRSPRDGSVAAAAVVRVRFEDVRPG